MDNFTFKHGADIVEDERNWKHTDLVGASPLTVKSGACKLGAYQPSEVLMQNHVGICTAIAMVQQAKKKYNKKYSSTFQYLMQKKMYDGNLDEGSSGQSALFVAKNYGFLPYEILPDLQDINPSMSYQDYVTILQSYTQEQINTWISQCENKIAGFASVDVTDYNAIAQGILDSETGLYCTTTVTEDWYTNKQGVSDWAYNDLCPISKNLLVAGGHAITIDSFDSTLFKGITWANTWSEAWCWKVNYAQGGIGLSNYDTVRPNQAWIIYWNSLPVKPQPVAQFIFNKDLKYGMANNDVKQLQIRLNKELGLKIPLTGAFLDQTLLGVLKYQRANNIPPTGNVYKLTRASLNNIKINMSATTQSWVARLLKSFGAGFLGALALSLNTPNLSFTKEVLLGLLTSALYAGFRAVESNLSTNNN